MKIYFRCDEDHVITITILVQPDSSVSIINILDQLRELQSPGSVPQRIFTLAELHSNYRLIVLLSMQADVETERKSHINEEWIPSPSLMNPKTNDINIENRMCGAHTHKQSNSQAHTNHMYLF